MSLGRSAHMVSALSYPATQHTRLHEPEYEMGCPEYPTLLYENVRTCNVHKVLFSSGGVFEQRTKTPLQCTEWSKVFKPSLLSFRCARHGLETYLLLASFTVEAAVYYFKNHEL